MLKKIIIFALFIGLVVGLIIFGGWGLEGNKSSVFVLPVVLGIIFFLFGIIGGSLWLCMPKKEIVGR